MLLKSQIKIVLSGVVKEVSVSKGDSLDDIKKQCGAAFGIKNIKKMQLKYQDAVGDIITVSTAEEIEELAAEEGQLIVEVGRKNPGNKRERREKREKEPSEAKEKVEKKEKNAEAKRMAFQKKVVATKIVRLGCKASSDFSGKGTYLRAKKSGEVDFQGGRGKRGIWLLHQLKNGDVIIASANEFRNLKIEKDSEEVLTNNNGGAGGYARWKLFQNGNQVASLDALKNLDSVQVLSKCRPNFVLGAAAVFNNRKSRIQLHPKLVNSADNQSGVMTTSFFIEMIEGKQLDKIAARIAKTQSNTKAENPKQKMKKQERVERRVSKLLQQKEKIEVELTRLRSLQAS